MHVLQANVRMRDLCALRGLGKRRHFQKLLEVFDRELHLPHVLRKTSSFASEPDHRDGEHHGKRRRGRGDDAPVCKRERNRKRSNER